MTATQTLPRSLAKFAADAEAAGMSVKVTLDDVEASVWVEQGERNVGVTFAMTAIYDSPLSNERLGFRTRPADRHAFRFSYSTAYSPRQGFTVCRSVRQARLAIGLAEK